MPIDAITIWPFILVANEKADPVLLNHEKIHLAQYRELWVIGFYILYVYEYLYLRLCRKYDHADAYTSICFESEAYYDQENLNYLDTRKKYAWNGYRSNYRRKS